jgi:chaperonin cofactor prefoldin
MSQKSKRSNELTKSELEKIPNADKMYRNIGKMFMLQDRKDVMEYLTKEIEREGKAENDLEGKLDYLERRMKSMQSNIGELTKNAASE